MIQVRPGYNPEYGDFNVITVNIKGKPREFVADYTPAHALNNSNGGALNAIQIEHIVNFLTSPIEVTDEGDATSKWWDEY